MIEVTYRCNNKNCRKVKGESNHWVALRAEGSQPTILPTFRILAFEDAKPDDEHYCGAACAIKRFAEIVDQLRAESIKLEEIRIMEDREESEFVAAVDNVVRSIFIAEG